MASFSFKADRPVDSYHTSDILFIISVLLLWGLGIFTLYVCTPYTGERLFGDRYYFVTRQLVWSGVGFVLLVFFATVNMKLIQKLLPFIVLGTFLLCLMSFIPGIGSNRKGASRWIYVAGLFTIQPSEFAKFAVVLFLANLFCKQRNEGRRDFYYPLAGLFVFVTVIFLQKDFSTGVFIFLVGCMMFFVCGARMTWFLPLMLLALPSIVLMVSIEPYRLNRVIAFLHPEEFAMTSGYQEMASKRAIRAGGFWGNGVGEGLSEVFKIPELQTDYIFAGWADSMGLVGVTAYFILLLFFTWRGVQIALTCESAFAAYVSFGCVSMIALQSLLNCAVVCGAAPTTGMPLPFFSSGGSSLVVTFCMCGFIINASHAPPDDGYRDMKVLAV